MSHFIQVLGVGVFFCLIGTLLILRYSSKEGPDEEQELGKGKIRHMYPDDDPEYTVGEDNTPDWKIGKVRNN